MSNAAQDFIAGLPKAELHLHIEGTLEPEMAFALAERNGVKLPYASVEAMRKSYDFQNLADFLDLYYQATQALLIERDFYDLSRAYLDRAREENVRHVEIFFDPQAHMRRGVSFGAVVEGLSAALNDVAREGGPTSRLIMCFLRDLDESDALATLEAARPWLDRITGVGLDSAEAGNPPGKFTELYERARSLGLRAVAHAGEEGPAAYVAEALDRLKVERIDHGVHAIDDAALVQRLARERVPLTVCPLSNIRLCVYPDMRAHPIRRLFEAGVVVTVNSDDPAYFGGYVNENYRAIQRAFELGAAELTQLAKNSFSASFLSDDEKKERIAAVDAYAQAQGA
ncbi:adenosine deaminase [Methylocystis sp. L43]|jgi:adenosine deaminase|uniref:adenosine deaminase n=1 Tax=unclassified Methylocystis TaxID=2625913 RepID=UPI0018C2C387|nr:MULTISPECIES: adenosine deaminase [unclassified Methylocystis]MBG0798598.1 adenosine deaminase [Methylocystis sp. L43]MBG0806913.1 adenosine deaminase [Methylocystis sp. H15]